MTLQSVITRAQVPFNEPFEVWDFLDKVRNNRLRFSIHEGLHELGNRGVVIFPQSTTPSTEEGIDVIMSVPHDEKIDEYLAEDTFVYKEGAKCKDPSILVVPTRIVKLKS